MKRQMRTGGFYIIAIMLVLVSVFFAEDILNIGAESYGRAQLLSDIEEGTVASVEIKQNKEIPTGKVVVKFKDSSKSTKTFNVSDVNKLQDELDVV